MVSATPPPMTRRLTKDPEVNIRSLTRGDGVVIGAAVLLFIASFLDTYDSSGSDIPNAWDNLGLVMSMYVGGIIGAALIVVSRALPQPRKVLGLELGPVGVALAIFAAWTSFWTIVDPLGAFSDSTGLSNVGAGSGLILGLIGALVLAAAAIATPSSPPSRPPSSRLPSPPPRSPTAPSRPAVTATPAPRPRSRRSPSALSRSRRSPSALSRSRSVLSPASRSRSRSRSRRRLSSPRGTSRRSGSLCRCRVRCSRRTVPRHRSPNSRRALGTWPSSSTVRAWWRRRRTAAAACCRTPRESSAADAGTRSPVPPLYGLSSFRAGGRCRTVAWRDDS